MMFPVNIVFDSNAVMDWFMGYMTNYGMKPEAMDEFKRFQADVLNTISAKRSIAILAGMCTAHIGIDRVTAYRQTRLSHDILCFHIKQIRLCMRRKSVAKIIVSFTVKSWKMNRSCRR